MGRAANVSSKGGRSSYVGKGSTGGFPLNKPSSDPQKQEEKPRSMGERLLDTMGQKSEEFFRKPVTPYKPEEVTTKSIQFDRVNPYSVQGQQIGPVQGMDELSQAQAAAARNAQTAGQMDPRMQQFLQAAQQSGQYSPEAINMMRQAAAGQGPSAAQAQMQAGTDQAIRAQLAAAGSRGFNPAAMRGAQMQGAEMLQTSANQAAQLRAQEQQAAQQQFLQASLQQEQMQRQAAMQAAGLSLDQDVASQQARQAAINAQGQIAGQFAGLGSQQAISQAELMQQAALANQGVKMQADLANQGASLQAQQATQDAALRAAMFNQQMGLNAWQSGQNVGMGWQGMGADLLGRQTGFVMGADEAARQRNFLGQQADVAFGRQMLGSLIGAGGAVGAAYAGRSPTSTASDKRAKTNIKPNDQTLAFLEALTDNSYDYKEPNKPGRAPGRQYGPMAQDLEKTAMGKTAVTEDADGTKMVDSARGFLLALSGLANVHQRLKALEA
jgi:hypothetical protein